eukprot:TRINITY_DN7224_c0_g1_i2.p1 TRINITY_DN7224_c0_g1~~TRINITY_DN7224_c0_g1_i2.p1  ORF type:complete len:109 (+),score=22.10 TRINITY_DN7224_c0_g1_i2:40-327(+)
METVKHAIEYVSESIQGTGAEASKEANKASCLVSLILSPTASTAALTRVPIDWSESLATDLLASLLASAPVPWIDSLTYSMACLTVSIVDVVVWN